MFGFVVSRKRMSKPLEKLCANCGKPFKSRVTLATGSVESIKNFNKRRFCSRRCAAIKTAEERRAFLG